MALALALTSGQAKADCGSDTGACKIVGGSCHIVLPEGADGPVSAILLLHGCG